MNDPCELAEARLALRYAMKDLTPYQRRCVKAYFEGSAAIKDLASKLGTPVAAIHANCHVAYPKMRKRLEELGIRGVSDILTLEDHDRKEIRRYSVSDHKGRTYNIIPSDSGVDGGVDPERVRGITCDPYFKNDNHDLFEPHGKRNHTIHYKRNQ